MEMGFVKGKKVRVVKNAPLKDPIEYSLLDYRVSLRRSEADLIEIDTLNGVDPTQPVDFSSVNLRSERKYHSGILNTIHVAFVGNPNAGKTSLFNFASRSHEHTGNYSGVTIDSKTARLNQGGYTYFITDLPGTYSLSSFSPEEVFVRDYIIEKIPDIIVNVVDVSNLERNLYLTTQLIDMDVKVVLAFNMYDELRKRKDQLDFAHLGLMLGIPIVPTVGSKGRGIQEMLQKIAISFNDREPFQRHIHINYGDEIESSVVKIQKLLKIEANYPITDRISSRFIAIKLLEKDRHIETCIHNAPNYREIIELSRKERTRIENLYEEDVSSLITGKRYGFISGALRETFQKSEEKRIETSEVIDTLLTHKVFGFPFFILFMWLMFSVTFKLGAYPQAWIESGIGLLGNFVAGHMPDGSLKDMLTEGIIGGVGGVIVFLPNILILFALISFMEDSGYMARAVFIMDKLMHKIGLHGKSFIPLIMGFGCNVPAIMATRTIEDKNNRLLTMLINPFMSCSARLPIYLLLIGAIFPAYQGSLLFLMYFLGILLAISVALLFKKTLFRAGSTPFVMELPPYRMPTARSTIKHMWHKGSQYLKKMGGVILVAAILLWALGYFPREVDEATLLKISGMENIDEVGRETIRLENSYIGRMGMFVEPALEPLGFNWKMGVSLITGIAAKEIVVSTLGVLHQIDPGDPDPESNLTAKIGNETYKSGRKKGTKVFNPLATLSFLLFTLIYFPCVAVFAAVKKESGNIWWAVFMVFYTTALAYLVSLTTYQIGRLFINLN
jgi:ferrous iron transport protein B